MTAQSDATSQRIPLTRARVLRAAVELADEHGTSGLTMRKLAEQLGVEAMSLYHHVANKEAVFDGVAEAILEDLEAELGGFNPPAADVHWKDAMRGRILAARRIMIRHPWAPAVFETRTNMSFVLLRYFESLLAIFRHGGFSYDLAHHAMHALGSRSLGFSQEMFNPTPGTEAAAGAETNAMLQQAASQIPLLVEMLSEIAHDDTETSIGWCDDQSEFEFALDLLLDGLDRHISP